MNGGEHYTPARLRALEACFRGAGYYARRSNLTDVAAGHVYWQSADWLIARGLAELRHDPDGDFVRLTEKGLSIARGSFEAS